MAGCVSEGNPARSTASFHSLMLALVGNRVAGASIAVTFTGRGAGGVHDFTVARSKSELEPAGE